MGLTIDGERDEQYEILNEIVRGFITSEDFGVRTIQTTIESDDEIRARSILLRTTKRVGDRFEIGLHITKGYARKLNADEVLRQDARVSAPFSRKFRLVFDAAAKVRGESLNSALLTTTCRLPDCCSSSGSAK